MAMDCTKRTKFTKACFLSVAKWLVKEIISGLAVAAAIAISTLWISGYQDVSAEKEQLKKLHLGLSQQYIDSVFGIPMVQFYDERSKTDVAIYKQNRSVVWCAYDKSEVVAYVIIVNSRDRLYKVNSNIVMHENAYLTEFTYADFSLESENSVVSTPANNDDYAYYSECYYGAGPADYNYFIIGSYKNYFDSDSFGELLSCQWANSPQEEIEKVRATIEPNAFGMIKYGYEDTISLIPSSEELRIYGNALFGDWYD